MTNWLTRHPKLNIKLQLILCYVINKSDLNQIIVGSRSLCLRISSDFSGGWWEVRHVAYLAGNCFPESAVALKWKRKFAADLQMKVAQRRDIFGKERPQTWAKENVSLYLYLQPAEVQFPFKWNDSLCILSESSPSQRTLKITESAIYKDISL